MLATAKARHPGALLVQGDAYRLPFPAGSFATVVTVLGLHLFPRPAAAVPEMVRVLRPDGVLLGAVPLLWPYLPTARALRRILDLPDLRLEHFERRRFLVVFRARVRKP
jgi:ubiquinone/menaquinone biosynthesis C-methylase UbiE